MITFIPGSLPVRPPHPRWCEHDSIEPDLSAVTHVGTYDVELSEGDARVSLVRHDDGTETGSTGVHLALNGREADAAIDPLSALRIGVALIRAAQDALAVLASARP